MKIKIEDDDKDVAKLSWWNKFNNKRKRKKIMKERERKLQNRWNLEEKKWRRSKIVDDMRFDDYQVPGVDVVNPSDRVVDDIYKSKYKKKKKWWQR